MKTLSDFFVLHAQGHEDSTGIYLLSNATSFVKVLLLFVLDSVEVKPAVTRKLRRRPNDPLPAPEKRRKTSHILLI